MAEKKVTRVQSQSHNPKTLNLPITTIMFIFKTLASSFSETTYHRHKTQFSMQTMLARKLKL